MATRLFHSVVVSSVVLLAGASGAGCASAVHAREPDRVDAGAGRDDGVDASRGDAAPDAAAGTSRRDDAGGEDAAPDAAPDTSARDAEAADALVDARAHEPGWPTTKGVVCTTPEGATAPAFCCRIAEDPEGILTNCCAPRAEGDRCVPCALDATRTRCTETEAPPP